MHNVQISAPSGVKTLTMLISHDTENAGRHANHRLTARAIRTRGAGACLLLLSAILALLWAPYASAQDFPPDDIGAWSLQITSDFPTVSTVSVGEVTDNLSIDLLEIPVNDFVNPSNAYSLWQVEPADAARVITPLPSYPVDAPVAIEFLRATTVTVRVRGYSDGEDPPPGHGEYGSNQLEFTFNVQASTDATLNASASALSVNERQAQRATDLLCDTARANPGASLSEQDRVLATCDSLALLDDPAMALDRISAEELFAIGDALTITADNQISNVQSRINALRAGSSESLDISALNIQLWDQKLSGTVLSASKDALLKHGDRRYANADRDDRARVNILNVNTDVADKTDVTEFSQRETSGGGASQDVISDSALGLFVNGNLSVGDIDGKGIQRDANIHTSTLTMGADYRLNKQRVIGAAVGIVNDSTEFSADNGDMDMQGISLSAFATFYEEDRGYADIIIDIGQHEFDLSRRVNLPGQASEFAKGSADANRMALSINFGRTFQRGATEFGPVGRMALTRASIDGFQESSSLGNSGNALELDVKSHTVTSVRFSLGAEARQVINTTRAVLVPTVRMDMEVENETDKGAIAAAFVNDPAGNTMNFIGADRDRIALLLSVGTTAVFRYGQSAFVFVETRVLDDHLNQSRLRLGYRTHF